MAFRAKLTVTGIMDRGPVKEVEFTTIYDQSTPEDQRFYKATPYSKCVMQIDNPAALEQCKVGKSFYVDFSPTT